MPDWFETRFREAVEPEGVDQAFATRIRTLVLDAWGEDVAPSLPADIGGGTAAATDEDPEEIIMLETEDRVTADEPGRPPRSSRGRWVLVAAGVAVIAILGALFVDGGDDDVDTATEVPAPPPAKEVPQVEEFIPLEPGRWFVDPDGDPATPMRVSFEIAAEGWKSWFGAVAFSGASHVVLTTMTVDNLVADACTDHTPADPPVGPTVEDLAAALTQLAPFEVSSPPKDVTIFGYAGRHVQLTVPDLATRSDRGDIQFVDCTGGLLKSWYSPLHDGGENPYFGYNGEPGRTEDFWILDVDGTRLVLTTSSGPGSMPADVAELEEIFDSIRIEP